MTDTTELEFVTLTERVYKYIRQYAIKTTEDALVELITNAIDAYNKDSIAPRDVIIEYREPGLLIVIDNAIGLTGEGLTNDRARALRESGIFATGVSLDSTDPNEHDRLRGKKGAFDASLKALKLASRNNLYPYIIAVATHDFLVPAKFEAFMQFASEIGALEVHLLEPSAAGKLAGKSTPIGWRR